MGEQSPLPLVVQHFEVEEEQSQCQLDEAEVERSRFQHQEAAAETDLEAGVAEIHSFLQLNV